MMARERHAIDVPPERLDMDVRALADSLTQILAPGLPRLVGRGMEAPPNGAKSPGDMEKAKALWSRLRQRVEEKPAAAEAVQDLARAPEDSDAQAALRIQIRKLLEGDAVLAAELASLIESADAAMSRGNQAAVYGSGAVTQGPGAVATGAGGVALGHFIGRDVLIGSLRSKSHG